MKKNIEKTGCHENVQNRLLKRGPNVSGAIVLCLKTSGIPHLGVLSRKVDHFQNRLF
jgi:hypothetical protein